MGVYSQPQINEARNENAIPITLKAAPKWLSLAGSGNKLAGYGVRQTLEPTSDSAIVLAEFADGRPAIIANRYGKGMAILIGTFLSLTAESLRHRNDLDFLKAIALFAGVSSPVKVEPEGHDGKIEARILRTEPGQGWSSLVFLFNHYPDAREVPWGRLTARIPSETPASAMVEREGSTICKPNVKSPRNGEKTTSGLPGALRPEGSGLAV